MENMREGEREEGVGKKSKGESEGGKAQRHGKGERVEWKRREEREKLGEESKERRKRGKERGAREGNERGEREGNGRGAR
uniref:Uncharacterized protein n=1 Tax=Octopus bimaculoides TaxID=37653 RepID=A0A0L8FX76_OCTBM